MILLVELGQRTHYGWTANCLRPTAGGSGGLEMSASFPFLTNQNSANLSNPVAIFAFRIIGLEDDRGHAPTSDHLVIDLSRNRTGAPYSSRRKRA